MNRNEQKAEIKEILISIDELKSKLEDKKDATDAVLATAEQLSEQLGELESTESFDTDGFRESLFAQVVGEEFSDVYDALTDLQAEISEYIEELPESHAEVMEEKYEEFDTVLELLDGSNQTYESIDEAIEQLDEAVSMLKDMLK